jgi:MYXO-CTERM domain-containing protein
VAAQLTADRDAGKIISDPLPEDILMPFAFQEGNSALAQKLNIVVLTNEMCASMCDMFAAVMQDNHLAKIVGSRTMGAGGNVVEHMEAPNSHLTVAQTESLVLRADGTPIENHGVTPDVALNTNASVLDKYGPVMLQAVNVIATGHSCTGGFSTCGSADSVGAPAAGAGGCSVSNSRSGGGAAGLLLLALVLLVTRRRIRA